VSGAGLKIGAGAHGEDVAGPKVGIVFDIDGAVGMLGADEGRAQHLGLQLLDREWPYRG